MQWKEGMKKRMMDGLYSRRLLLEERFQRRRKSEGNG
jgi:hypothetical protein